MLETRGDEHLGSVLEDVDGAIAVVDIEVEDGHPFEVGARDRGGGSDCDVAVEAKAHPGVVFGVVSGGSGAGEDALHAFIHHETDGFLHRAGGEACGVK